MIFSSIFHHAAVRAPCLLFGKDRSLCGPGHQLLRGIDVNIPEDSLDEGLAFNSALGLVASNMWLS